MKSDAAADGARRGAILSSCGKYRYHLWRDFDGGKGLVTFIMLNPSTADAYIDDPTIRKCSYYAQAWGFGRLGVVNLFSYRATDPKELLRVEAPIGPDTRQQIQLAAHASDMVVCAWGRLHKTLAARQVDVLRLLEHRAGGVYCLGLNNDGSPKHPLYLRNELQPMVWAHQQDLRRT